MHKKSILKLARLATVVFVTLVISYFFAMSEKWWIPVAAIFVMRAPIGSSLRYGLQRYLVMIVCVLIGSLIEKYFLQQPSFMPIYMRLSDVTLGAMLGIIANLFLWPVRPDVEFRQEMILVLKAYSQYLVAIENLILRKSDSEQHADIQKQIVEKTLLLHTPFWVYESGFNVALRQGHRHFLVMVERVGQLLFSMHHAARHEFDETVRQELDVPLKNCVEHIGNMFSAIIAVLNLEKIETGLEDFDNHVAAIEKVFQKSASPALELLDISTDYSYFAAFIYDLKDLRSTLLLLLAALR